MSAHTGPTPIYGTLDWSRIFPAIARNAPWPMATMEGPRLTLRFVNPAFGRLMKFPADRLFGRPVAEFLPVNSAFLEQLSRVYATGKPESHLDRAGSITDPVFASYLIWPIMDGGEDPVGIMLQVAETSVLHEKIVAMNEELLLGSLHQHELTEAAETLNAKLQTEIAARQRLESQLRQAQKMEAVGQLTGGIAHDFNNMLSVIMGHSEILLDALKPGDPCIESLKIIREAGDQAAALTQQLLAFSRQTVLDPKVLDLNTIVAESELMLRRVLGEDLTLHVRLDPNLRRVKVDPGHIKQVLMNIAVNARDAMPRGGKLTIETRNVELDEHFAHERSNFVPGHYALLMVTDTGSGMSPSTKSHMFEPFFTTKAVGKGSGLGLAVVHGIIEQSGGHIEVYSEPDLGTAFKIYFPTLEESIDIKVSVPPTHLRGTETILLVEDAPYLRKLACHALETQGYTVLQAGDGQEALRLLETFQGELDLLATDVVMPLMGGRELAAAVLPRFPKMKVLYMSGYTDDAVVRHGVLQSEVAFLQKPYAPNALRMKVRQVLDQAV